MRGLKRLRPSTEIVRVQEVGLQAARDEAVLTWAARERRIVITRDRGTMPSCALARLRSGEGMPGLLVLRPNWRSRMGEILLDLILICECTEAGDWEGRIEYLPL